MRAEELCGGVSLVPYTLECLDKSWIWLNDPEIRELTMTPLFTKDEQQAFFTSLPTRIGYNVWGVSLQGYGLIGAAGLKNQRGSIAEYWGYIGEREFWGRGLGRSLIAAVEEKAIERGFTELDLKVSATNVRAITLYAKTGFIAEPQKSDDRILRMIKRRG